MNASIKTAWEIKDNELIIYDELPNWLQIAGKTYGQFLKEIFDEYGNLYLDKEYGWTIKNEIENIS